MSERERERERKSERERERESVREQIIQRKRDNQSRKRETKTYKH